MEKYEKPVLEFIEIDCDNVVLTSGAAPCPYVHSCPNAYDPQND